MSLDLATPFAKPEHGEAASSREVKQAGRFHALLDRTPGAASACAFLRAPAGDARALRLSLRGTHRIASCPAGGWLVEPARADTPSYWVAQAPRLRRLDAHGHILDQRDARVIGMDASADGLAIDLALDAGWVLDLVVWQMPAAESDLAAALREPLALERQPWFQWSSHTAFSRPADLYLHLVFGNIYENHAVWPRFWRVCSELDACALYVTLSGLERATGKRLYGLLKRQVVAAVIDRQAPDGGWYHGEWTDNMESHYRLVNAAVLMLSMHLEEDGDARVREAAAKGAAFLVARANRIRPGTWFMHDSLEGSLEGIRKYPFPWSRSTALGKSVSTMLILNTHLDSLVTLERYAQASGDTRHAGEIASAREAARAVVGLAPASWLYGPLFRILDLTLLPKAKAMRLPLLLRALKRVGWKYLAPQLHRIKAVFPRLVMPNGYIDRALCQHGFSTRYQSVHVWDLARYLSRFGGAGDEDMREALDRALEYTQHGDMRGHWKEDPERQDALGFWAEALYRMCLIDPDPKYRAWLAEAMLDCEEVGVALPPSLLGANAEAVPRPDQRPCPSPADARLRVANLARGDVLELVVVNPTAEPLALDWERPPAAGLRWSGRDGAPAEGERPVVPAHGWLAAARP
ncbi:MAG: hypothetical protein OHK0026_04140 [Rhodocyclaceae bacterium]